eukprot:1218896-Prymnesium_polylepis.1
MPLPEIRRQLAALSLDVSDLPPLGGPSPAEGGPHQVTSGGSHHAARHVTSDERALYEERLREGYAANPGYVASLQQQRQRHAQGASSGRRPASGGALAE